MRCDGDVGLMVEAATRGARGNMAAAWCGCSDVLDGPMRDRVCETVEALALSCPVVSDDVPDMAAFVWLDGSRRALLAGGRFS